MDRIKKRRAKLFIISITEEKKQDVNRGPTANEGIAKINRRGSRNRDVPKKMGARNLGVNAKGYDGLEERQAFLERTSRPPVKERSVVDLSGKGCGPYSAYEKRIDPSERKDYLRAT